MKHFLHLFLIIFFIIFITIFVGYYIGQESIYDNYRLYAYHLKYCMCLNLLKDIGILNTFNIIFKELQTEPSTFLSVQLISIPVYLLHLEMKSRFVYISLLMYIYLLPSTYLIVFLYKKFVNFKQGLFLDLVLYFFVFFNVIFWYPTLRGLPDIAAVLPFSVLIVYSMKFFFSEKIEFKKMVVLGILSFVCILFRRTFSTTVLIWFMSLFSYRIFLLLYKPQMNETKEIIKKIRNLVINSLIIGFSLIISFAVFFKALYLYFINGYMTKELHYYNYIPIIDKLTELYQYISPLIILLLLIPIIYSKRNTNFKIEPFIIISYIYICLYFIVFLFLQILEIENYIPMNIFICIIACYGINIIFELIKNKNIQKIMAFSLIIISLFNFYQFFYISENLYIFPCIRNDNSKPLVVENKEIFFKLYDFISEEIKKNPKATVSSIAGIRLFDPETLYYQAYINNNIALVDNIINIPAPNTYGINFEAYNADYIVNVTPWIKNSVAPDSWLPISIPMEDFVNNTGIAKSFEKIYELETDDKEYTVTVYKRTKELKQEDLESIIQRFTEKEPNLKNLIQQQYNDFVNNREQEKSK